MLGSRVRSNRGEYQRELQSSAFERSNHVTLKCESSAIDVAPAVDDVSNVDLQGRVAAEFD